jgi:hypothetical protein
VEAAREAAKKEKLRQMGEGAGVARTSAVLLDSSVERLGRWVGPWVDGEQVHPARHLDLY